MLLFKLANKHWHNPLSRNTFLFLKTILNPSIFIHLEAQTTSTYGNKRRQKEERRREGEEVVCPKALKYKEEIR